MAATSLHPIHIQQIPAQRAAGWRWRTGLLWAVACCLAATAPLQAVPMTIPTDLAPGAHYRLAFVTQTGRDATSTNIADYNAFVTAEALSVTELAVLGTTWAVIGSTATVNARQNTGTDPTPPGATGVPIYLLNNTRLVDDYDDLWDSTLGNPLNVNENGTGGFVSFVWTGTFAYGFGDIDSQLGTPFVGMGLTTQVDYTWIAYGGGNPTSGHSLYGLSGDLVVPGAVPEPGTFLLLGSGMGGLLLLAWRRTRRRTIA